MKVKAAVASNIGNLRENNEDNFYFNGVRLLESEQDLPVAYSATCDDAMQFYAVCDGMGGEAYGEEASLIAVNILSKYQTMLNDISYHSLDKYMDMYFAEVNAQICEVRKDFDECRIGTTIALLIVDGENINIVNVGDSRVYRFYRNKLTQLSEDHTPAVRAYKMGQIKKDEIKSHPHRNKLTQYLGVAPGELNLVPSRLSVKARNNERYLICSDGVTDMLSDDEISRILKSSESPEVAVKLLIEKAKNNGGRDNITAIVLDIEKEHHFRWLKL